MKLKEATGAGVLDCKKALDETKGDYDKAIALLREKGKAKALKKNSSDRVASEGVVASYIHMGGKIGVLVEINCETDFAQKSEKFNQLVKDVAMHIAAANPKYVNSSEVPAAVLENEKEILKKQAMEEGKPAAIAEKMMEGRIKKYYQEYCLMDQPFVKDGSKTITDVVNETIAFVGEKITIRRFVRYEMGEGIEKTKEDFAAEVSKTITAK